MKRRLCTLVTALTTALLFVAACTGAPSVPSPTQAGGQPTEQPTLTDQPTATPAPATATADPGTASPGTAIVPDLSRVATGETPGGWQEVTSADGACRMAVPADWDTETMAGTAIAPTFAAQVTLSNDPLANGWQGYVDAAKQAYFGADKVVLIDSDQLFLMTAGPSSPDLSWILGVNGGETACGVLVIVTGRAIADLGDEGLQILYSLAPVD